MDEVWLSLIGINKNERIYLEVTNDSQIQGYHTLEEAQTNYSKGYLSGDVASATIMSMAFHIRFLKYTQPVETLSDVIESTQPMRMRNIAWQTRGVLLKKKEGQEMYNAAIPADPFYNQGKK